MKGIPLNEATAADFDAYAERAFYRDLDAHLAERDNDNEDDQ